jgi:predicted aspartyl protease
MRIFHANLTLENLEDVYDANRKRIKKSDIHTLTNQPALVDTGAWTLIINQDTADKLGLEFDREDYSEAAGGAQVKGYMAKPLVRVRYAQFKADVEAFVIPEENEIVLGALPMEIMDLWINPRQELLVPKNTKHMVK